MAVTPAGAAGTGDAHAGARSLGHLGQRACPEGDKENESGLKLPGKTSFSSSAETVKHCSFFIAVYGTQDFHMFLKDFIQDAEDVSTFSCPLKFKTVVGILP